MQYLYDLIFEFELWVSLKLFQDLNLNKKIENSIKQVEPIVTIINDHHDQVEFDRRNSSNNQSIEKKDDLMESKTDLEYLDWWSKYHSSVREDYDEPWKQIEQVNETDLDNTASEELDESESETLSKRGRKRREKRLRRKQRRVKTNKESFFASFKNKRKMTRHQKAIQVPNKEMSNTTFIGALVIPVNNKPKVENIEVN